jgi:hypothetical protein
VAEPVSNRTFRSISNVEVSSALLVAVSGEELWGWGFVEGREMVANGAVMCNFQEQGGRCWSAVRSDERWRWVDVGREGLGLQGPRQQLSNKRAVMGNDKSRDKSWCSAIFGKASRCSIFWRGGQVSEDVALSTPTKIAGNTF